MKPILPFNNGVFFLKTRKSKTEAVLQRRSMLKLGVICKFIEALWKVLYVMKCSLGVPSVMLGRSNFSVYFRYTGRVRNFGYFLQFV